MNVMGIEEVDTLSPSLRKYADRNSIRIGTCASIEAFQNDPVYVQTLKREFNLITPENALKFGPLCPEQDVYNFEAADRLVDFAEANNMEVRGHALVWNLQLPAWLSRGNFSRSELIRILTDHIKVVVGRYAGRIKIWDVVNEAIDYDGTIKESIWSKTIGPDFIDIAFHAAHAADPAALLFYNDYGTEAKEMHADGVYKLLQNLLHRNVPVDGVGLQMHLHLDDLPAVQNLSRNFRRLSGLRLLVHITELDVRLSLNGLPNKEQLAAQAYIYGQVLKTYLAETTCKTIILWGFTDRYDWIPHFFPGDGASMIFDEEYKKKPGYEAVASQLTAYP